MPSGGDPIVLEREGQESLPVQVPGDEEEIGGPFGEQRALPVHVRLPGKGPLRRLGVGTFAQPDTDTARRVPLGVRQGAIQVGLQYDEPPRSWTA